MCACSQLPGLLKIHNHPDFLSRMEQLDMAKWQQLMRCRSCGQLWAVDEWEKYQWQYVFKIATREGWESVDQTSLRKNYLAECRGGLTDQKCLWAGCDNLRVRGVFYCVDHLYKTGARE